MGSDKRGKRREEVHKSRNRDERVDDYFKGLSGVAENRVKGKKQKR